MEGFWDGEETRPNVARFVSALTAAGARRGRHCPAVCRTTGRQRPPGIRRLLLMVAVIRGLGGSWRRREGRDPEQIPAERFAAGEIDEEEYYRRLQTLRSARHVLGEPQC